MNHPEFRIKIFSSIEPEKPILQIWRLDAIKFVIEFRKYIIQEMIHVS
ncbi:MAG: hypothetical protein AAF960_05405 [Bacteroidota bacterium]